MKKQLLFFLLLISVAGSAQIVNIPDENFKSYLLSANGIDSEGNTILINANEDDEIQVSEAEAVWELIINDYSGNNIEAIIGIEAFINLHKLSLTECNELEDIDLTSLINLEYLAFNSSCQFTNVPVSQLHIQGLVNLKDLIISDSFHTGGGVLNVEGLTGLENLNLDINGINNLDFSQLTSLKTLNVYEVPLAMIDLTNNTNLEIVSIDPNIPVEIQILIGNMPNLYNLDVRLLSSFISELDLSGCTALTNLRIDYISDFYPRFLNLKNGITSYDSLILNLNSNAGSPLYVCIDEGNEGLLPEPDNGNTNMLVSTYCSFIPGGDHNTITGNFTFDGDSDGCDANDNLLNHTRIDVVTENEEEFSAFSNNSGVYNFYTEAGTFTLTPSIENSDWFTITPASTTITFADDNNNVETQNFCVIPNGEHPDVEVVIVPTEPAQPGFNASYKITYRNKGNQTVSGNILLTYDETVLDYVSSTSGVGAATNTFGWSYNDLQPFETRNINLTLNVNAPTDTPAVNIDDLLMFTANITSATGDETPDDNTFTLAQTVVGSFDPNDITCLEGEAVHVSKIGDYLHYNINFENTGTAPATFIVVKNEINEEQFDVSTLQLMDASHNVETKITGNEVEFYFGDINLAANGGKGNVLYKIKTLNTLQEDDIVMQEANIYFDYNFPIETNEANTTFAVLSNNVLIKDDSVKLYPNPTTDNVTIAANSAITSVQLYDVQGRLLHSRVGNETSIRLDVSAQPSGLYFVKITTDNGSKVEKLVKE